VQLYDYQLKAVSDLRSGFLANYQRQVLQSATGSGKTIMFSDMAFKTLQRGNKVIIITDRIELCKQTFKAISHYDNTVEVMTAGARISPNPKCIIAMVETLNNHLRKGWDWKPDLIIIDEAHKGNFTKILDHWLNVRTIGATATPIGKHFHKYYQHIVTTKDIPHLIEDNRLSPCRPYQMQDSFDDLKKSRGEFTDDSLFSHFNKPKLYSGVVEKWKEKATGLKTLVFCVNIKHAEETAKAFNDAGILAECITSKSTKEDRDRILRAHQTGCFNVLVNCGILTTGYDDPTIKCIVVNRATLSLPLWLQMCGRGSRVFKGKSEFLILDFGMNHDRFGRWDSPRVWDLKAPKKKSDKLQAAPVKLCPSCEAMLHVSVRTCEFCGYKYPEISSEQKDGELVEVPKYIPSELIGRRISSLSLLEIFELQKAKRYKASFCWRVVRSQGDEAIFNYAKLAGYSRGWSKRQLEDINNSEFTDYLLK